MKFTTKSSSALARTQHARWNPPQRISYVYITEGLQSDVRILGKVSHFKVDVQYKGKFRRGQMHPTFVEESILLLLLLLFTEQSALLVCSGIT